MSVNGIGGGTSNVLQEILKAMQRTEAAQAQRAGGKYDQNEAVARSSGGGKPEMTKATRKKDDDEKTPKELMEEMQRVAQKRQDAQPTRIRAASPAAGAGGAGAANRTTAEYTQHLQANFSYMNNRTTMGGIPTTVSVSPAFIAKCANDPAKAKYLEENLADLPNCAEKLRGSCPGLSELSISFDSDGEIVMVAYGSDDPKAAAENAKRKAREARDKAEELQEKLEEKRAERKEKEEKASEKGSSRSLTEKLTVRVAEKFELAKNNGTDIAAGAGQQFTISETGSFTSEDGPIGGKIDSYS